MNNFVLTDKGAVIEITNNSTEQIITNNEGFISPTLTPLGNTVSNEIKPAFTIQIPSFVSYKINNIAPGDSISFVVTKPDEVFYYLGIANSKIEGISVTVTPITNDTVLQDKTITPTTTEQVITADEGYDGLGTVTIEAVTASIDENITAENIKKDVEILGVTGSYEGSGGGGNATLEATDTEFNYLNNYQSLLTSIEIPDGITSIGEYAFTECAALTSVIISNTVIDIGNYAFSQCSALASVTIGNSVKSIGEGVFQYCSALTSVTIPGSVENLGTSVFNNCTSLRSATIISGITEISSSAFDGCASLESIIIPESVISIGDHAFANCTSLSNVTLGTYVNDIYDYAFSGCASLESITFPNAVRYIGTQAFQECTSLTFIEFLGNTPPELESGQYDVFDNVPTTCIIYVPNGTLSAYTSASYYPDPSVYTYIERPAT